MIRDATAADFKMARPLYEIAHAQTALSFIEIDHLHIERLWVACCAQEGAFSKVVVEDGEIVGLMFGMLSPATFGGIIAQDIITYSKKDTHKLIRQFLQWAKDRGADAVQITDISGGDRYWKLIKRLGLQPVGLQYMRIL